MQSVNLTLYIIFRQHTHLFVFISSMGSEIPNICDLYSKDPKVEGFKVRREIQRGHLSRGSPRDHCKVYCNKVQEQGINAGAVSSKCEAEERTQERSTISLTVLNKSRRGVRGVPASFFVGFV